MNKETKELVERGKFVRTRLQKINFNKFSESRISKIIDVALDDRYALISKECWQIGGTDNLICHSIKTVMVDRICLIGAGMYADHKSQYKEALIDSLDSLNLEFSKDYLIYDFNKWDRKAWLKNPLPLFLLHTYKDYKQVMDFLRHAAQSTYNFGYILDEMHMLYAGMPIIMRKQFTGKLGDVQVVIMSIVNHEKTVQVTWCSTTSLNSRFREYDFKHYYLEAGENYVDVNSLDWTLKETESLIDFAKGNFDEQDKKFLRNIPTVNEEYNIVLVNPSASVKNSDTVRSDNLPGLQQLARGIKEFREEECGLYGSYYATYTGDGLKVLGHEEDHNIFTLNGSKSSLTKRIDEFNKRFGTKPMLFLIADNMVTCGLNICDTKKTRRIYGQIVDRNKTEEAHLHRIRANIYSKDYVPKVYSTRRFKNEACDYVEAQKIIHKGMEEEGLSYEEAMSNVPVSSSFFKTGMITDDYASIVSGAIPREGDEAVTALVPDNEIDPFLAKSMEVYCTYKGNLNKCPIILKAIGKAIPAGYNSSTKLRTFVEKEIKKLADKYLEKLGHRATLRGVFEQPGDKARRDERRGNQVSNYVNRDFTNGLDDPTNPRTVHYWYNKKLEKPVIRYMTRFDFDKNPNIKSHNFDGEFEVFTKERRRKKVKIKAA